MHCRGVNLTPATPACDVSLHRGIRFSCRVGAVLVTARKKSPGTVRHRGFSCPFYKPLVLKMIDRLTILWYAYLGKK